MRVPEEGGGPPHFARYLMEDPSCASQVFLSCGTILRCSINPATADSGVCEALVVDHAAREADQDRSKGGSAFQVRDLSNGVAIISEEIVSEFVQNAARRSVNRYVARWPANVIHLADVGPSPTYATSRRVL